MPIFNAVQSNFQDHQKEFFQIFLGNFNLSGCLHERTVLTVTFRMKTVGKTMNKDGRRSTVIDQMSIWSIWKKSMEAIGFSVKRTINQKEQKISLKVHTMHPKLMLNESHSLAYVRTIEIQFNKFSDIRTSISTSTITKINAQKSHHKFKEAWIKCHRFSFTFGILTCDRKCFQFRKQKESWIPTRKK